MGSSDDGEVGRGRSNLKSFLSLTLVDVKLVFDWFSLSA